MSTRTPPEPLPIEPYFRDIPGCEPFLQAIAEEPDDDVLRLVFADWLEDAGHSPRAEFIRLQIQYATKTPFDEYYSAGTKRASQLLEDHRETWIQGLNNVAGLTFARGMLETLPLHVFAQLPAEERRLIDVRCAIMLSGNGMMPQTMLRCEQIRFLVSLTCSWRVNSAITALLSCQRLTSLRHLNLGNSLVRSAFARLTELPMLSQLQSLNLGGNPIGDEHFLALLRSANFPKLRALGLSRCQLTDESALVIADSEKLAELTYLDLSSNKFKADASRALARSKQLVNLTHFDLRCNRGLGVVAKQEFANATNFPRLRYLAMDGYVVESTAGVGLARVQEWAQQASYMKPTHLDLSSAAMTNEAMQALLALPAFASITTINLSQGLVRPEVLALLAQSPKLAQISKLDLSRNRLKSQHVQQLANSPHAINLRELNLSHNAIDLDGANAIVTSPYFKALEQLQLQSNHALAELIANSPRVANITKTKTPGELTIRHTTHLTEDLVQQLVDSHYLTDFTKLRIHSHELNDAHLRLIADSPRVANLTKLELMSCWRVTQTGLETLAWSTYLESLTQLVMHRIKHSLNVHLITSRWPFAVVKKCY